MSLDCLVNLVDRDFKVSRGDKILGRWISSLRTEREMDNNCLMCVLGNKGNTGVQGYPGLNGVKGDKGPSLPGFPGFTGPKGG